MSAAEHLNPRQFFHTSDAGQVPRGDYMVHAGSYGAATQRGDMLASAGIKADLMHQVRLVTPAVNDESSLVSDAAANVYGNAGHRGALAEYRRTSGTDTGYGHIPAAQQETDQHVLGRLAQSETPKPLLYRNQFEDEGSTAVVAHRSQLRIRRYT